MSCKPKILSLSLSLPCNFGLVAQIRVWVDGYGRSLGWWLWLLFRLVVWWGLDQSFGLKFGWCIGQHLGGDWVSFWVVLSRSLGRWVFWWWWHFFFFLVILVVMDWCLWLSFGGRWLCGFIGERERERERDFSKYYLMCSLYYF